jgi:hypothetical protein
MRSVRAVALAALAASGALALSSSARAHSSSALARSGSQSTAAAAAGSHLQVTEVEYRLLLSRGVVKAGPVSLETIDRGMDPHDVRLRALASRGEIGTPELTPGRRWDRTVYLKPGVYALWCTLPEHARLGMHATLRVVR